MRWYNVKMFPETKHYIYNKRMEQLFKDLSKVDICKNISFSPDKLIKVVSVEHIYP